MPNRLFVGLVAAGVLIAGSATPLAASHSGGGGGGGGRSRSSEDPIVNARVLFSSYFGGSDLDQADGIALDNDGNMYLTGETRSLDLPVSPGAPQPTFAGVEDAFVARVNADYTLGWVTYLGGIDEESPRSIAVDDAGNVYTTGSTKSADFPTTPGAYQEQLTSGQDIYLTKYTSAGDLVFSTYFGGNRSEGRPNVVVDSAGTIHLSGFTTSQRDFPLVNPLQSELGGKHDNFALRMSSDGAQVIFSTYLGGSDHDTARCVATDDQGNTYVHGWTMSTDFPTTAGAYQNAHAGGMTDVFVTKYDNQSPPQYAYSTYIGGSGEDWTYNGDCMDVDTAGSAYLTGFTFSSDWPTVNAFQPAPGGMKDAYVAKLSPDGASLDFSTYLGGEADDEGIAIAVDWAGYAHATGMTKSFGFPIVNASLKKPGGWDGYVTKFDPLGNTVSYSMFLGGKNADQGRGVALDDADNAYVIGSTGSSNFPTVNAFEPQKPGKQDAYITKVAP